MPRVLIVDDHPIVRMGVRAMLEQAPYIVRVLAERMGVRASFAPNPDGGSVFFVDVPRPQ